MSYWSDWYSNSLQANRISLRLYEADGTTLGEDISADVSPENCFLNRGTSEGLFNAVSQETLTIELKNQSHKYDGVNFKGRKVWMYIYTDSDGGSTYQVSNMNFYVNKVTVNDEYLTLECTLIDLNFNKPSWSQIAPTPATTDNFATTVESILYNLVAYMTVLRTIGYSLESSFSNKDLPAPTLEYQKKYDYWTSTLDSVTTTAEMLNRFAQILGGYATIKHGQNYPSVYIKHFPKTIIEREQFNYAYGGTFDETDSTYSTGDSVDGNASSYTIELPTHIGQTVSVFDGGSFTNDFYVLNDDVISELTMETDYYAPLGIVILAPYWQLQDGEYNAVDREQIYAGREGAYDLTDNDMIKLLSEAVRVSGAYVPNNNLDYATMLENMYEDGIGFGSVDFEATVINNLRFEVGDVVAISSGVMPTRYSYIENINTDLFGATILSNNRSE